MTKIRNMRRARNLFLLKREAYKKMWQDLLNRQLPFSQRTTDLTQIDNMVKGLLDKQKVLLTRIDTIENEYHSLEEQFLRESWMLLVFPLFGLFLGPFQRRANAFVEKWEKYEPGWP